MSQNYLGIDVHKKWCVFTQIDSTGKVMRQSRFRNTLEEVSIFASSLNSKIHLVLEPVLNYLPNLCQIEVKTSKNIHNQIKPDKNWKFLGIKELCRNLMHH